MLKKILILLLILLSLAAAGYYILYTEGAFQTKEDVYKKTNASSTEMKCEAGKCGAAMQKSDSNITPTKKCGNN